MNQRHPNSLRTLSAVCLCLPLLLLVRCAEEVDPEALLQSEPATRFALVTLTYSERASAPDAAAPKVMVNGVFARHAGVERDEVLRILNLPNTLDSVTRELVEGACVVTVRDYGDANIGQRDGAFVDLIDAGDLQIRLDGIDRLLRRRTFPDIFPMVSGLTYEGELPNLRDIHSLGRVSIESHGSHEIGNFGASVTAPPIPRLLEVGGSHITTDYASIDWSTDLDIKWQVQNPDPSQSPVFVEIKVVQLDQSASLHCRVPDKGSAGINLAELAPLANQADDDATISLVVRRVRRTHFMAPKFQLCELTFVSRDAVFLQ